MKAPSRMRRDERCLDCEARLKAHDDDPDDEGRAGSPHEPYDEGHHVCGKAKPRIVRAPGDDAP